MISKPTNIDQKIYYAPFLDLAKGKDVIESLLISKNEILELINSIEDTKANYRYEKGKWSIKQILQHISDVERIQTYRALRYSKNDKTDLPGFNENEYAEVDNTENLSLEQIKNEFIAVRNSTIELFKSMNSNALDYIGTGNTIEFTPRIIGWKIAGHATHHYNVIKERYL